MSLVISGLDYVLDSRNFYAKHDYDVKMDSFVIAIVFPCKNYEVYSCSALSNINAQFLVRVRFRVDFILQRCSVNLHLYEELTNIHIGERITCTLCSCKQFSLAARTMVWRHA